MLTIEIPGRRTLRLEHLVLDYNGTLGLHGDLLPGVSERLRELARVVQIHIVTADTFHNAAASFVGLPCAVTTLPPGGEAKAKRGYVKELGASACVCIGNGRNDQLMLKAAGLGIAVIQQEGAYLPTVLAAEVVTAGIRDALDLLAYPERLVATLRG